MSMPTAAVTLFTLRDFCKTIEEITTTLARIKEIGYDAFQISAIGPVDPVELGKVVADSGMTCCITHMGWNRFKDDLDGVIADHHAWGCKHTCIGILPEEYNDLDGVSRFLEELAPIAEALAAEGLDFSYHNHSHELIQLEDGETWLGKLYRLAPHEMLKAELDTYWIQHGGGDPAQWIRDNAGRVPVLHFKDFQMTSEGQRFAPVGEGNLNWPAIVAAAQDAGTEYCVCEQDHCWGEDPFISVETSYRNMKAMGLQ